MVIMQWSGIKLPSICHLNKLPQICRDCSKELSVMPLGGLGCRHGHDVSERSRKQSIHAFFGGAAKTVVENKRA